MELIKHTWHSKGFVEPPYPNVKYEICPSLNFETLI
jgi:hypothetical protein